MRLNQAIAIEKTVKAKAKSVLDSAYHSCQKSQIFDGLQRTYAPVDDEGEKLPAEQTRVQMSAEDLIQQVALSQSELFDNSWSLNEGNTCARASVVVDGQTIVEQAPVTFLLFLEKKLVDLHTFVSKLPLLNPSQTWSDSRDPNTGHYHTEPVKTHRSKKVPKPIVLAPATKEHPAQTQLISEDVIAGYWTKVDMSGAIPDKRRKELLERIVLLQQAVKLAREEANTVEVQKQQVGKPFFDWLFA